MRKLYRQGNQTGSLKPCQTRSSPRTQLHRRQQGQQRPGGEFFPPGAGAGEEEQDQRRRDRAAVEVGAGCR